MKMAGTVSASNVWNLVYFSSLCGSSFVFLASSSNLSMSGLFRDVRFRPG